MAHPPIKIVVEEDTTTNADADDHVSSTVTRSTAAASSTDTTTAATITSPVWEGDEEDTAFASALPAISAHEVPGAAGLQLRVDMPVDMQPSRTADTLAISTDSTDDPLAAAHDDACCTEQDSGSDYSSSNYSCSSGEEDSEYYSDDSASDRADSDGDFSDIELETSLDGTRTYTCEDFRELVMLSPVKGVKAEGGAEASVSPAVPTVPAVMVKPQAAITSSARVPAPPATLSTKEASLDRDLLQHCAATAIQAWYRGNMQRQRDRYEAHDTQETARICAAAVRAVTTVQAQWRGKVTRRRLRASRQTVTGAAEVDPVPAPPDEQTAATNSERVMAQRQPPAHAEAPWQSWQHYQAWKERADSAVQQRGPHAPDASSPTMAASTVQPTHRGLKPWMTSLGRPWSPGTNGPERLISPGPNCSQHLASVFTSSTAGVGVVAGL